MRSGLLWGYFRPLRGDAGGLHLCRPTRRQPRAAAFRSSDRNGDRGHRRPGARHRDRRRIHRWKCLTVLSHPRRRLGAPHRDSVAPRRRGRWPWEQLLAGQTTPRHATHRASSGWAAGVATLWAVTALITVIVGRSSRVGHWAGRGAVPPLPLVSAAAMFLAVGALTSQLAATRRQAAGFAAPVLGSSYALRMVADSGTGLAWLRWVSPLGWIEELQPLTSPKPLAVVPIAATSSCRSDRHLARWCA